MGTKRKDRTPIRAYNVGGESSSGSNPFNSTPEWRYDVFLSFAGKDTRLKFIDHLDEAFTRSGIKTFMDDVDLERGGNIKQDLFQAIQNSLCAVTVISENYANSTWCLDELQMILESRSTFDLRVFPIFYDVDPADIRYQRKRFQEALAEHEKKFTTQVQNWRNVLFEIGNLSGWDTRGMHEADLIKNITGEVWTYLCSKLPSYDDNLVGIESRMGDMRSLLEIGLDDRRFVGIWGMGGVGKTTLARVVFEKLSYNFEMCCFVANVRETLPRDGLVSLQKKLLSHLKIKNLEISDEYDGMKKIRRFLCNKKVLLVLDGLDDMSQLKNLADNPNWFGRGSRIIITTRDRHLLTTFEGQRIYEMKTMKKDESLQLFSNKAFNSDHPEKNYLELSKSVVEYAGGLPLALEALGYFLRGRSEAEWRDTLDRLKKIPNNNILQVLKISYDVLNEEEKTIFLDIACFFKGWQTKEVIQILESCDLHPTIGIKVLIEKTLLIETEDYRLEMHDLFEDLGRYIIHQESPIVGKRSRLWKLDDIKEILENNKGSKAIQAIVIKDYSGHPDIIKVHPETFLKMSKIRLLLFDDMTSHLLILPRELRLSGALKVIRRPSFPFKALPLETSMDKLVDIQMPYSKIKQFWSDIQFMKKLKSINLSFSSNLTETPEFSRVPYLQHLNLRGCTSLVKVHHSLGKLKKLVEVYLDGCKNLEILPRKLETNSLMKLDLGKCFKVAVLPEFGEGMKKLSYLDVSDTAITRLPELLGSLTGFRYLDLSGCKILGIDKLLKTHITRQISGLNVASLTELYLKGCGLNDRSIPDDFGCLPSLIVLDISGNCFVNLPTSCLSGLFQLLFLSLDYCARLKSLPRLPPQLIRLSACCCNSMRSLSDRQLWILVGSLDLEYRKRTKYVIYDEEYDDNPLVSKHVKLECLLLRDFCAIIPGDEIPSWFPNIEYYPLDENRGEYVVKADIPPYFRHSKWSGIVLCFHISGFYNGLVTWGSKAAEDDDYKCKEWAHYYTILGSYENRQLWIMVLELNEETCWQHLRAHHSNSLHIKLSTYKTSKMEVMGCGWRVICKEDIQEWCNLSDSDRLTQPQLATPRGVELPKRVVHKFLRKMCKEELPI